MKKIALIIAMISLQSCISVRVNADVDSNSFYQKANNPNINAQGTFFENGVNDYLSKPYNFEELLNKLYHNLKNNTGNSVLFMESQQKEIASEKLIDFKYLKDFSDGDDTFVKNMISLFLNNTPETMQIILESNKNDDIKILKDEIHKLKSSLSILGMIKASNCVEVIEMEIEKNPLGQKRKDEVNNLNEICQLAIKELELTDEF